MSVHYTYEDVLAALAVIEPASTNAVFLQLEGDRRPGTNAKRKRRKWVWYALLNMAGEGRVEYVIDDTDGHRTYTWQTRKQKESPTR